ncbi:ATP-binding protein [Succinivibrio sp.]|uniref:ATP-binding protein n=1 Tax=Succinivibrio sp. TaxID=2053619 RepID=UPI0025EE7CF0|nr:ATP-binding protein [Succinivibrio sp.]MBQ9221522.1 putative DNA binding domain-containing protein [Succinivibrio sp.]
MSENQNVEYKEIWKDDYLKWICGFANAQGGTIYIGLDDNGVPVGLKNIKKLLEDLPNKILSSLALIVDVNKCSKDGVDYIEIKVPKSSIAINYHGEYHYRSGATKQLLTGSALNTFLAQKLGRIWEDEPIDNVNVSDLDDESFKIFRREAAKSGRMSEESLNLSNEDLLKKLNLLVDGKLKRSAVLLFYRDPSVVRQTCFVQVGKFSGADIEYQDMFEGSLLNTADKILDIIYLKYLKAKITYERGVRRETYPYAYPAVREAIFNALVHNCYMYGSPIHVRINEDEMIISNNCVLPEGWTVDTLMQAHTSIPYNLTLANVFFRAGYIEHWGRGIEKICEACKLLGADNPVYEKVGNTLSVHFKALKQTFVSDSKLPSIEVGNLNGNLNNDKTANISDIAGKNNSFKLPNVDVGNLNGNLNNDKTTNISDIASKNNSFKLPNTEVGNLNEIIEQQIIALIKHDPSITLDRLVDVTGASKRSISRITKKLTEEGIIERKGGRKFGLWQVNK